MKIIFEGAGGKLSVIVPVDDFLATLTGTDEEKLIHLANRKLPTGTKYEIVADDTIPSDRAFRDAWEYTADASVEKTSADLSLEDQLKYGRITQKEYDDAT